LPTRTKSPSTLCAMNLCSFHMNRIFFVASLLSGICCYSQDTSVKYTVDTALFSIHLQSIQTSRLFLYHLPQAEDKANVKEFGYLINQKPTEQNYKNYYKLACSLWQLNKLEEAEILFLNIIRSKEKFYTTTYRHSSDVSGDTSTNLYGYGSYTSNYKNWAAIYLTKLYLEQKDFRKALRYLEDAVKKYPVTYTCGTGHFFQQEEYTALYAYCYEGLKKYNKVLDVLLPHFLNTQHEILISTVKRLYTTKQIESYLQKAENSLRCTFDTLPSVVYQSSNKVDTWDTLIYYSGRATINLFGRVVELFPPALKNEERVTREHFIKRFKESQFYLELANTASPSAHTTSYLQKSGDGTTFQL
jgi:tetratricopeptide (TPR) repeat protein